MRLCTNNDWIHVRIRFQIVNLIQPLNCKFSIKFLSHFWSFKFIKTVENIDCQEYIKMIKTVINLRIFDNIVTVKIIETVRTLETVNFIESENFGNCQVSRKFWKYKDWQYYRDCRKYQDCPEYWDYQYYRNCRLYKDSQ